MLYFTRRCTKIKDVVMTLESFWCLMSHAPIQDVFFKFKSSYPGLIKQTACQKHKENTGFVYNVCKKKLPPWCPYESFHFSLWIPTFFLYVNTSSPSFPPKKHMFCSSSLSLLIPQLQFVYKLRQSRHPVKPAPKKKTDSLLFFHFENLFSVHTISIRPLANQEKNATRKNLRHNIMQRSRYVGMNTNTERDKLYEINEIKDSF